MKLTEEQANKIYDILVTDCGALENNREMFIYQETKERVTEWRFCGSLGFGGKFWNDYGAWRISCYPEDSTPAREKLIQQTNQKLFILRLEYSGWLPLNKVPDLMIGDMVCHSEDQSVGEIVYLQGTNCRIKWHNQPAFLRETIVDTLTTDYIFRKNKVQNENGPEALDNLSSDG